MILSIIIITIITVITFIPSVSAVDSTPSAGVKSKLEELKKEIASKAAKYKDTVNKKLKNKAYVGAVKSKSQTSLTLAFDKGPRIVNINQDTRFESKIKPKAKTSLNSLGQEDYVAALGDIDETGVLTAIKIILLNPNTYISEGKASSAYTLKPKTYLWGQVVSISDERSSSTSKLITLKLKDSKNLSVSLPKGSKVRLNDYLIISGNLGNNDIFEAGFSYIVPQSKVIKLKPGSSSAIPSSAR